MKYPMIRIALFTAPILFLLAGCATVGQKFSAGEPKNSLPFMSKDMAEEMHSIAVPPFSGDGQAWHEAAQEVIAQAPKASIIPQKKIDSAVKTARKDPGHLSPEERIEYVSRLGRAVQADAVLNGIILSREDRHELILQLVSSRDSRVLWLQSADFSFKGDQVSRNDQKELLHKLLSPLFPLLGSRDRPVQQKQEMQRTEPDQKSDKKSKPSRKPGKGVRPEPAPEDVSPM